MKITEEQVRIIKADIEPIVEDFIDVYGEEVALKSLFAYVSMLILHRLGGRSYSESLRLGLNWLENHTDRGRSK